MENFYAENTGDDALAYFNVKVHSNMDGKKFLSDVDIQKQTNIRIVGKIILSEKQVKLAHLMIAYVNVERFRKTVKEISLDMLVYVLN